MSATARDRRVTSLLLRWEAGTPEDRARLFVAVHDELQRIARAYMHRERAGYTLQPTALVNEAYIRLTAEGDARWRDRAHFYGIAARAMRQILVDHARKRRTLKRGMGVRATGSVTHLADPVSGVNVDVLALHLALEELATLD